MSLNVAVRSRSFRDSNVTLAPSLYARIRMPSYFSSKTQPGRWKGVGTRSASMGRTWVGMWSITIVHLIRESQDCPKAPSCINRPFDGPLRHDATGKETWMDSPHLTLNLAPHF